MATAAKNSTDNGVPISRRSLSWQPATANVGDLSVEMIVATEAPATQLIPDPFHSGSGPCPMVLADEVLTMDGIDFSRSARMNFVDSHDIYSTIDKVLGSVMNLRVENQQLIGKVVFRARHAELVSDIAAGHLQQISVGYTVQEYEVIPRTDGVERLLVKAVRWTPHEVSAVTVAADIAASFRSQNDHTFPMPVFKRSADLSQSKENKMDLATLVKAVEDAEAATDAAIAAVATAPDEGAPEEVVAKAKAIRARAEEAAAAAEKKPEETAPAADAAPADAAKEEAEQERLRSVAKTFGFTDTYEAMRAVNSHSTKIRAAIESAIIARGVVNSGADRTPVTPQRSAAPQTQSVELDPTKIWAERSAALARY